MFSFNLISLWVIELFLLVGNVVRVNIHTSVCTHVTLRLSYIYIYIYVLYIHKIGYPNNILGTVKNNSQIAMELNANKFSKVFDIVYLKYFSIFFNIL